MTRSSAPRRRGMGNESRATTESTKAMTMVAMLMMLGESTGSPPVAATHRLPRMATAAAMVSSTHGRRAAPEVSRARRKPLPAPTSPANSRPAAVTLSRTARGMKGINRNAKTHETTISPTVARRNRRWARAGALNAMAERYRRAARARG